MSSKWPRSALALGSQLVADWQRVRLDERGCARMGAEVLVAGNYPNP
jgi:hypothetical protein